MQQLFRETVPAAPPLHMQQLFSLSAFRLRICFRWLVSSACRSLANAVAITAFRRISPPFAAVLLLRLQDLDGELAQYGVSTPQPVPLMRTIIQHDGRNHLAPWLNQGAAADGGEEPPPKLRELLANPARKPLLICAGRVQPWAPAVHQEGRHFAMYSSTHRTFTKGRSIFSRSTEKLTCRSMRQFKNMFITPLYQQHASHTLASRAYGPQPHMRS